MTVRDLTILGSSSQQPTRYRNHSGYILRWNDEGLLFDPGEGTQRQFIFANIAPNSDHTDVSLPFPWRPLPGRGFDAHAFNLG